MPGAILFGWRRDMTLRPVHWDEILVAGALQIDREGDDIMPMRLTDAALSRCPAPSLALMARMTAGVRLVFDTDSDCVELDLTETGFRLLPQARRPAVVDCRVGTHLLRRSVEKGPTITVDLSKAPPGVNFAPGTPSTVRFDGLGHGMKRLAFWLPHAAFARLHALRIMEASSLHRPVLTARSWWHYGSSISHGMDALGPSETWPAIAAIGANVELTHLGFAGECMIDGFVADAIRDGDADLISLKLAANVVGQDVMRERAFVPAIHNFLDIIRERKPRTPIILISPVICPMIESQPGPILTTTKGFQTVPRAGKLASGALTMERARALLSGIVSQRSDPHLHYLSGLDLLGSDEADCLHDGLHPDAAALVRMGERFHRYAFAEDGPFAQS